MEDRDRRELIDSIYRMMECKEAQTRLIIDKFIDDIALFDKKHSDYGSHNISKFGLIGVLVRSSDKIERLINLKDKEELNESIEDSWQDLTVYGAIARVVLDNNWKD